MPLTTTARLAADLSMRKRSPDAFVDRVARRAAIAFPR
jgi:hypothetical protein